MADYVIRMVEIVYYSYFVAVGYKVGIITSFFFLLYCAFNLSWCMDHFFGVWEVQGPHHRGSCGHRKQFLEMAEMIRKNVPEVKITGNEGRQASFEISINDQLVYSKLQTMAFPDYETVTNIAKEVSEGQPIRLIKKEQPIDCSIS